MAHLDTLRSARAALTGTLVLPDDPAYDEARLPWNRAVDQRPAGIASPADVADLRTLLGAVRDAGSRITVQPSGHGASGDLAGAVVVRMGAFDDLEIDLEAGTARIGAGVRWGAVIDALEGTGWSAPAGTSPVVTAVGYTLGGGHSWFSRTAGLGSDSLRAAWVLLPDGTHDRLDDVAAPELLWALRGAGGLVGVVTAIEIDLVRTPALLGGTLTFDAADGPSVLRAVRDLGGATPRGLNVFVNSMRMPDAPQLPAEIRGRSFVNVDVLALDDGAVAAIDRIRTAGTVRREVFGPTSPGAMAAQSNEPTEPTPGRGASAAVSRLDDATIDALFAFHARPEQWPLVGIGLRLLGGALDAPRRHGFASLAGVDWLVHGLAPLFPGAPDEPGDLSLTGLRDVLGPATVPRLLPTFLSAGETVGISASPAEIARLREVRAAIDPEGLLHEGRLPR